MKTDHVHVEASVAASFLIAVLAVIDLLVNVADGHPAKAPGYVVLFIVFYSVARLFLRRSWR